MIKVLYILESAVHDKISHAGGKTVAHYISLFNNDPEFEVAIAFLGDAGKEADLMKAQFAGNKFFSSHKEKNVVEKVYDGLRFKFSYPLLKKLVPKYYITNNFKGERLRTSLTAALKQGYQPDVIIAEFTSIIFWIDVIKDVFPNAKTIASAHDVTFQSVKRAYPNPNLWGKLYYNQFKRLELAHLSRFDLIATQSYKDQDILEAEPALKKVRKHVIAPYFDTYQLDENAAKDSVIFFGAMGRLENIDAAEWFLNSVWTDLQEQLPEHIKYVVVGGGISPEKRVLLEQQKNVVVTGFVKNPEPIFSKAICFVVPLRLGAGIKVKVLEAMNGAIPVVTNKIGIEGIPAKNGESYLHCEDSADYLHAIKELAENPDLQYTIGKNGKQVIDNNFNLGNSFLNYKAAIKSLI